MDKLKLHTPDFTNANVAKLTELFPNCVTESRDEQGNLKRAIDFEQLRQELSANLVEEVRERYQLTWPGKQDALLAANSPIAKTLRPTRQESVSFDTTKNLFIEGDNLEALKLLQETYLNKLKLIYIDPPYNTGNDFIYKDDFQETTEDYFERSLQIDDVGNRMVANTDSNGRFHSDWLSMLYSRVKLSRKLLRDDGVMFISIDDNEQANLKKLCDEVFGASNFLGCACRVSKKANNQGDYWSPNFDYLLTYAKNRGSCPGFFGGINYEAYDQVDDVGPRAGEKYQLVRLYMTSLDPMRGCANQRYYIEAPDGTLLIPPGETFPEIRKDGELIPPATGDDKVWRWARDTYLKEKHRLAIKRVRSSNLTDSEGRSVKWNVFTKTYLNDVIDNATAKPNSLIEDHINQNSSHELKALDVPFSFAKPSSLIRYLCEISRVGKDDIILDFYAGSGTTAHAILSLNESDGGRRRYILVQIPEPLDPKDNNHKAAISFCKSLGVAENIAEITKERIRRVGKWIKKENPNTLVDLGFRVLKVETSNMKDVYYTPDAVNQSDLLDQIENIREDRTPEDLLFQVLLDWGVDLGLPIEQEDIEGKTVFFVDQNALAACFERDIKEDVVKKIAARKPLRAVFRDAGFGNDSVKINVEQIFKLVSPSTEVRAI